VYDGTSPFDVTNKMENKRGGCFWRKLTVVRLTTSD
jgi:hypothetical protein